MRSTGRPDDRGETKPVDSGATLDRGEYSPPPPIWGAIGLPSEDELHRLSVSGDCAMSSCWNFWGHVESRLSAAVHGGLARPVPRIWYRI